MTGWAAEKGFQRRLEKSLTRYSMLSTVLQQEFDRYYLEKNYHHIAGSNDAKAGLTIVGSLACRHCRRILQEIDRLPEEYLRKVRISFIPYPLASACNQRVRQEKDSHPERCLLAEQTIEALKKGEFRAWLAQVENAPGRILRRLRRQGVDKTTWDTDLTSMIDKTNSISVTSIPYLIWEGQKLPPLYGTLPLEDLIARMLRLREDRKNKQPESVEDCDC